MKTNRFDPGFLWPFVPRVGRRLRSLLCAGLLLGSLGLPATAWAQVIPFEGDFAPSLWSLDPNASFNPGAFTFLDYTGADTAQTLQITSSANPEPSVTTVRMTYQGTQPTFFNFGWALDANGNFGAPSAFLYVDNTTYNLAASPSSSVPVPAGATVAFELDGNVVAGKTPSVLRVQQVGSVPDSISWFGVLPWFGLLFWHAWSRRQPRR